MEHIGYDVGAFFRFYYLHRYSEFLPEPVHLVGICENPGEALFFAKLSGYYRISTKLEPDSFFLSFLLAGDIASAGQLQVVTKYGDSAPSMAAVVSAKEMADLQSMIPERKENMSMAEYLSSLQF